MSDYRVQVTVEVDVTNADSESQARQAVFSLLGTPPAATKGRPASGPRAVVTGITIAKPRPPVQNAAGDDCIPPYNAANLVAEVME